jgi:sterol desaturase/sphingolipid hydroxylase (fatty acid hydroxylase superfamily)
MVLVLTIGIGIAMLLIELVTQTRKWTVVRGWWTRAILLNVVQLGAAVLAAYAWDPFLAGRSVYTLELGSISGPVVGYVIITFIFYWWHRARHVSPFLWRWFHQVHHSPARLEILTSFYKHPFEILINSVLTSSILTVLLGLPPSQVASAMLITGLAELFYHWNVPTPHWLGYLFQRPESHCVHHKEGWHQQNYADLPLWDILFGTFHNPKLWSDRCGFANDGEQRLGEMLRGKVIT